MFAKQHELFFIRKLRGTCDLYNIQYIAVMWLRRGMCIVVAQTLVNRLQNLCDPK